jgi:hypothetical protein
MRGHGCKFPRLLRLAVEAHLEEPTFAQAAARTGIARSTLFLWAKEDEFQALYREIRGARLLEGVRQFMAQKHAENVGTASSVVGSSINRASDRIAA